MSPASHQSSSSSYHKPMSTHLSPSSTYTWKLKSDLEETNQKKKKLLSKDHWLSCTSLYQDIPVYFSLQISEQKTLICSQPASKAQQQHLSKIVPSPSFPLQLTWKQKSDLNPRPPYNKSKKNSPKIIHKTHQLGTELKKNSNIFQTQRTLEKNAK